MRKLINIFAVVFAVVVLLTLTVKTVGATFQLPNVTICHVPSNPDQTMSVPLAALGGHLGHGDYLGPCSSPTPSPSPSPSPSPEPEEEYCDDESALNYKEEGECQYPEEEATPSGQPLTRGADGCSTDCNPEYHAPVCSGADMPDRPAWKHVDRVSPTEVRIEWGVNSNPDKYALVYGYVSKGDMPYGIPHINGDSRNVNVGQLAPNEPINVRLYAYKGACSVASETIDP